jgi:hypothetical protein
LGAAGDRTAAGFAPTAVDAAAGAVERGDGLRADAPPADVAGFRAPDEGADTVVAAATAGAAGLTFAAEGCGGGDPETAAGFAAAAVVAGAAK